MDDPRELMNTNVTKWKRVFLSVNAGAGILCYRRLEAYKYKWKMLLLEYKKVANLNKQIGVNNMA